MIAQTSSVIFFLSKEWQQLIVQYSQAAVWHVFELRTVITVPVYYIVTYGQVWPLFTTQTIKCHKYFNACSQLRIIPCCNQSKWLLYRECQFVFSDQGRRNRSGLTSFWQLSFNKVCIKKPIKGAQTGKCAYLFLDLILFIL